MIFMTVFNNHFYAVFPLIFDGKMGSKITPWPTFDTRVVGFLTFWAVQKICWPSKIFFGRPKISWRCRSSEADGDAKGETIKLMNLTF